MFWSLILILTSVLPLLSTKFEISLICLVSFKLNSTSKISLLNKSFKEAIFLTLILLKRFSLSDIFLLRVKINELPSTNAFLFSSKISEKINNSNTLDKSVNFIIA